MSSDCDLVGVGLGPANLSVAALIEAVPNLRSRFFERRPELRWHDGLLFPEAQIQVSHLKDLVTMVDPTSPYSFLAFLRAKRRLYRFVNADFPRVSRWEFDEYLRWVGDTLTGVELGREVESVHLDGDRLVVQVGGEPVRTRHVVLGLGRGPHVPEYARPHVGADLFHGHSLLRREPKTAGRRVAVVGGGQTGAEVVYHLLGRERELPSELIWLSRRPGFQPLDETAFTNEWFSPYYSDQFFALPAAQRRHLNDVQKLASDGVSPALLAELYRRLYELEFRAGWHGRRLLPGRELLDIAAASPGWELTLSDLQRDGARERVQVDLVILCTGYRATPPRCLDPLAERLDLSGELEVREDFSLVWDGPTALRIYLQNRAATQRGVADRNLSLVAWRAAKIVNSVVNETVYELGDPHAVLE